MLLINNFIGENVMDIDIGGLLFLLGIYVGLAFIPANIAKKKGYGFGGFWFFGFCFFLIALIVSLCLSDRNPSSPYQNSESYYNNQNGYYNNYSSDNINYNPSDYNNSHSANDANAHSNTAVSYCPNCGNKVNFGDSFCFNCGFKLPK